jgi:hypothetical protein
VSLENGYQEGIIIQPQDFECEIKVRSERRREVIQREFATAKKEVFGKYDVPEE